MKTLSIILATTIYLAVGAYGHQQAEHLKEAYKDQGDEFFVPLYWLPETRQTVVKHIPDNDQWVGFELGLWKKISEDKKLTLLDELGAKLDEMEGSKVEAVWNRVRDWQRIHSQLSLLAGFLDEDESFLDLAFEDPTLRSAFQWIIDRRPPGFNTKHIGSTLATGESASFYPHLVEHLLNTPERQRLECFSRLLAQIAETKPEVAQTDSAQPAIRPESKSEGSDKLQSESEWRSK